MTSEQGPAGREELIAFVNDIHTVLTSVTTSVHFNRGCAIEERARRILAREPPKLAACAVCGHDACFTNTGAITCYHQCWTLLQCCERAESRERVIARWNTAQGAMAGVRNTTT
jgi:hypothetical protein